MQDLQDTVNCGKKSLVDFNVGQNQLLSSGIIDVKMDGPVLDKKIIF